jgi:hypothetical protein
VTYLWQAEVTVAGVPSVTEEEFELMRGVIPGLVEYEADTGDLLLTWLLKNGDPHIQYAIDEVSSKWRTALAHVESAPDPVCTDFRVYQVSSL